MDFDNPAGAMLILAIIVFVILFIIKAVGRDRVSFCTACGTEGPEKLRTKGSILIEIVLWLMFIVPGVIYSIWRHASRDRVCAACGNASLVPPDSPMARKLRADLAPR